MFSEKANANRANVRGNLEPGIAAARRRMTGVREEFTQLTGPDDERWDVFVSSNQATRTLCRCQGLAQIRFAKNISARHLLGVSTIKEIERAVAQLLPKDFAKLSAWMKKHKPGAPRNRNGNSANGGADWFDVYMACPHSFEIPLRKKQFYKPKA